MTLVFQILTLTIAIVWVTFILFALISTQRKKEHTVIYVYKDKNTKEVIAFEMKYERRKRSQVIEIQTTKEEYEKLADGKQKI